MGDFTVTYSDGTPSRRFTGQAKHETGQGGELTITDDDGRQTTIPAGVWSGVDQEPGEETGPTAFAFR